MTSCKLSAASDDNDASRVRKADAVTVVVTAGGGGGTSDGLSRSNPLSGLSLEGALFSLPQWKRYFGYCWDPRANWICGAMKRRRVARNNGA